MNRQVHIFENGIKIYEDHLIPCQRERLLIRNVHEAEEEDIFTEIIQSIPPKGCFINIGSAIGYYPLLAKRISHNLTIHAVEPLERFRDYFIENIKLNGNSPNDFVIHKYGISSHEGFEKFVDNGFGSSLLRGYGRKKGIKKSIQSYIDLLFDRFNFLGSRKRGIIRIQTITLDTLMNFVGRSVDLLQMDVQGLEIDVLKSGVKSLQTGKIKKLLIGTHSLKLHQDCNSFLREFRYIIEFDEYETIDQPDGIIVASK